MKRSSRNHGIGCQTAMDGFDFEGSSLAVTVLTQAAPIGAALDRTTGLLFGSVVGVMTLFAGNNVTLILEGSHDAVVGSVGSGTWFTLASSPTSEVFSGNQTRVLNEALAGVVDFQRWKCLRVRATGFSNAAPVLTCTIVGRALDGVKTNYVSESLTRTGVTVNGIGFVRQSAWLLTCGCVNFSAASNGTTFTCNLQGSYDGGTTYVTIASSVPLLGTGAAAVAQLLQDGNTLLNLGGYDHFRVQITDDGAGVPSYATALAYLGFESCDVRAGLYSQAPTGSEMLESIDCTVTGAASAEGAFVADQIRVTFQVNRLDGTPLLGVRNLEIVLSDTLNAGADDLATNATIASVTTGTALSAVGGNRIAVVTNAAGVVAVNILDAGIVESVLAMAFASANVPNSAFRFTVVQTDQVICAFT